MLTILSGSVAAVAPFANVTVTFNFLDCAAFAGACTVPTTFVNTEDSGLVILPTHRVVHGLASFSADALHDGARAYFSVEEVDPTIDAVRANAILRQAGLPKAF